LHEGETVFGQIWRGERIMSEKAVTDVRDLTLIQLLGRLTVPSLAAAIITTATLLGGAFALGVKQGSGFDRKAEVEELKAKNDAANFKLQFYQHYARYFVNHPSAALPKIRPDEREIGVESFVRFLRPIFDRGQGTANSPIRAEDIGFQKGANLVADSAVTIDSFRWPILREISERVHKRQ
jgi:hypothetical protein